MQSLQKLIAATTLTVVTLLPVMASARTYTKLEVLEISADTLTSEFGQVKFTMNIKKKKPYATVHGTVKVKRSVSDDYEACNSKATY